VLAAGGALLAGCAEQTFRQTQNFDRPLDIAVTCWRPATATGGAPQPVPVAACSTRAHRLYGFVTNSQLGDVAVLDLLNRTNIDVPFREGVPAQALPGFTRARVGELPAVIVADPRSTFVYTVNRGSGDLSRIDATPGGAYTVVTQRLPFRPYDAVVGPWPDETWTPFAEDEPAAGAAMADFDAWEERARDAYASVRWALYVSAPADGVVLVVPLDGAFGTLGGSDLLSYQLAAGAPRRLAMTPDGATLFATHLDRGWVSAVDVATGAEERLWIAPACANGIDDDGDGLVDGADPGCEHASDDHEGDPETGAACDNGVDDDGDGLTDGDDPGCDPDPAVPECANGVDDDGDGLVDLDDPGCASPRDDSEGSDQATCRSEPLLVACTPPEGYPTPAEQLAIALRCGNGVDDDGDGRTDAADEGECPGLLSRPTDCWNALDDDEDGATDTADERCLTPFTAGERLPACSNGVDDDGDGFTDWPADSGCYGRDDESELGPPTPEVGPIAVSPDGAFVYVGDQTSWSVHVFAWPGGERVDVLGQDPLLGGNPVARRFGRRGIQLGATPRGISFVPLAAEGVTAFVTAASGTTTVIETVHPGLRCSASDPYRFEPRALHRLKADSEPAEATLSGQPVLLRGADALDLAFAVIPEFPTLGSFGIDELVRPTETACAGGVDDDGDGLTDCHDPDCAPAAVCRCGGTADGAALVNPYAPILPEKRRTFYGVTFTDDVRLQPRETWTVRYEGVLPGTGRRTGRLLDDGTFHDPGVDWCALGVEPGDLLIVQAREGCAVCGDFVGERFEWRIAERRADTLVLAGPGRAFAARPIDPNATTVCLRAAGVTPEGDPSADFTLPMTVTLAEDLPLPTPECFGGALDYEIRVPGQYLVTGDSTGYLHNWRSDGGRCVLRADADERFTGRAAEATLVGTLGQCPPRQDVFTATTERTPRYDGPYFQNPAFRLRVYPGCRRSADGRLVSLGGQTERDIAWQFTVSGGLTVRRLATGQLPGRAAALGRPTLRRVYIVDSSGEAVFEVNAELDAEAVRDTFF
jgi:DNA-binding beta-propeller fold protein YncE